MDHPAALVTTGQSLLLVVTMWLCLDLYSNIPWSICVGCTSDHVKESRVRVAGTALLDGSLETAVARQWKCSPRHADLYLNLVLAGR